MKSNSRVSILISAAIISIAAFFADAQTARPDFNRRQTFDVQHYTIRTSFDRLKKKIMGETVISLKPLAAGLRTVELDSVGIAYDSITLDPAGTALRHTTGGDKVTVTLDRTYGPTETITVKFKYTAVPKKGIYFVPASSGKDLLTHSEQIYTHGEPDEARHWFPSFDFPSDKATSEQYLTAPKTDSVIANGKLIDKVDNNDGTATWHFKMDVPHSTYLVSFVIGQYVRSDDTYRDIPMGVYVYPGMEQTAVKAFGETKTMMRAFEEVTGVPYPYNKYDQTVVSAFAFGGMENITATTLSDKDIDFVNNDFGRAPIRDLVSHELAHSWFGNLVTCRNWAELWLNEGFATYMEAVYLEKLAGREIYLGKIRTDAAIFLINDLTNKRRHGLFNLKADDLNALFDTSPITYNKGSAVIHTLREQVGAAAFWKGINLYLNRHKLGNVETNDLRKAMEEASGQELGWFFDQWVYGTGYPKLDVRQEYSTGNNTVKVTITQTQTGDGTPQIFRLPMEVAIEAADGKAVNEPMDVTKRTQIFIFKANSQPESVNIDPGLKVPLKDVKIRPMTIGK